MAIESGADQKHRDGLYHAIIGTALLLAVLLAALLFRWGGPGRVLAILPWFIPVVILFQSLALFSVAFLTLGRYHVLRSPPSFWIGMGAAGFGILLVFHALSWPGLEPDGSAIIGELPSTPAWFLQLGITIFSSLLLSAALVRRPREYELPGSSLHWLVTIWAAFLVLASILIISIEEHLPMLITADGVFTTRVLVWNALLAVIFATGAVMSTLRYLQTGDVLLGYIAFIQIGYTFSLLATVSGMQRYDVWWYLLRVILTGSTLIVLFGLLYEYVQLYQRERERAQEVLKAEEEKLEFYRRTILAATSGKLILCDPEDVEALTGTQIAAWEVRDPENLRVVRDGVMEAATAMGMDDHRTGRLIVSVVEAVTNAIKHAGEGLATLYRVDDALLFMIEDHGPGIPALTVPDVALRERFSTAGTLGMGYKIMISSSDRVYLSTGPEGTTVAILVEQSPAETPLTITNTMC